MIPAPIDSIERDDIGSEAHIYMTHWHWMTGPPTFIDTLAELVNHIREHRLQLVDLRFREERI